MFKATHCGCKLVNVPPTVWLDDQSSTVAVPGEPGYTGIAKKILNNKKFNKFLNLNF